MRTAADDHASPSPVPAELAAVLVRPGDKPAGTRRLWGRRQGLRAGSHPSALRDRATVSRPCRRASSPTRWCWTPATA